MKRILFLFALLTCPASAFLQDCDSTMWAKPGSYEVVIDTNSFEADITPTIMLTGDDLCYIESQRKAGQTVQINLRIYLITILPGPIYIDNTIKE